MSITQITPELILILGGLLILLLQAFARSTRSCFWLISLISLGCAFWNGMDLESGSFFSGMIHTSAGTLGIGGILLGGTALAILFAPAILKRDGLVRGEFYTLVLWGTVGMIWMVRGSDLLMVLIGLELLSICLYSLAAYYRDTDVGPEAALKYFLMGAFASAILIFGSGFYYGLTGVTRILHGMGEPTAMFLVTVFFILSAFAFKMALFPVHGWAPDVYQGSASPVTTYLSTLPKVAAAVVFIRFFELVQGGVATQILVVVSVLTMFMGNLVAMAQRDVKRMLAYSGIAHMGYLLIGVIAGTSEAYQAVFFYLVVYVVMTMTAFAVVGILGRNEEDQHTLQSLSGYGFTRPFFGFVLAVCLFSLTGIPPFAGFMAKFNLFKAGIDASLYRLVFIGILNSIISIYFYIRVVYYLYMKTGEEPVPAIRDWRFGFASLIALLFLVYYGVFPDQLINMTQNIAGTFLGGW